MHRHRRAAFTTAELFNLWFAMTLAGFLVAAYPLWRAPVAAAAQWADSFSLVERPAPEPSEAGSKKERTLGDYDGPWRATPTNVMNLAFRFVIATQILVVGLLLAVIRRRRVPRQFAHARLALR